MPRELSYAAWRWSVLAFVSSALAAPSVAAQDRRPSEDEMFGGKPAAPSAPAAPTPAPSGSAAPPAGSAAPPAPAEPGGEAKASQDASAAQGTTTAPPPGTNPAGASEAQAPAPTRSAPADSRDEAVLGGRQTPMFTEEAAPSDPLRIGGQIYLRSQMTAQRGANAGNYSFSTPSLTDVYFDARPNDRVRGFVLGRMIYDPTLPTSAGGFGAGPVQATGGTSGSASLSSLFGQQTRSPRVALDQLWLRFDVAHTVFVTAGKQHVRWGTGHFWSPTDFLHLNFRNPLDVFDARTGTTMIKLHVPIESKAWNFYAYGLTENADATGSISRVAGAARAEFVVDAAEFGVGALERRDQDPRVAADVSFGIGDFDLYGELALKNSSEVDRVGYDPGAPFTTPSAEQLQADPYALVKSFADAVYKPYRQHDYRPQAVGGLTYSRKYNDNDTFTVGAEYFYNGFGYTNTDAYFGLVLPHSAPLAQPAPFFYLGQHYGAVYVTFPAPFSLDLHTFTLSTLGNLSDRSFITRLDYSLVLLTHLRFEAFASARYGNQYGEFRFGVKPLDTVGFPGLSPAIFDLGMALRLAI